MRPGVNPCEAGTVLCLEGREKVFLPRNGLHIIQSWLGDGRHAGDEGRTAVRLYADRGAVGRVPTGRGGQDAN